MHAPPWILQLLLVSPLVLGACTNTSRDLELPEYRVDRSPCGPAARRGKVWYELAKEDQRGVPAPGKVRHSLANCTDESLWIRTRGRMNAPGCKRADTNITVEVRSQAGRSLKEICDPFGGWYRPRYRYEVLAPGERKLLDWGEWYFEYLPTKGQAYSLSAEFHDIDPHPPVAPKGSRLFRGPIRSNELEFVVQEEPGIP
jgi:hypothetical protein